MQKILLFSICLTMLGACCNLKKLQRDAVVTTTPTSLDLVATDSDNPTVDIDFIAEVDRKNVPKRGQLIYQPQFLTSTNNYELQAIVVNGRKTARKEAKMAKQGESLPYPGSIRLEEGKEPVSIKYDVTTPVQEWMPESELIGWTMVNCNKRVKELVIDRHIIATSIEVPEKAAPKVETITEEIISESDVAETSYFEINSDKYNAEFDLNYQNVKELKALLNEINNSPNMSLVAITLTGSASPDGTEKINSKLATGRADNIAQMLTSKLNIPMSMIKTESVGANWDGFIALIQKSNLPNISEIVSIAKGNGSDIAKTEKMRMLHNYDLLKTDYLPILRNVHCRVFYTKSSTITKEVVVEN